MNLNEEFLPYTGPPDIREVWKKYILAFLFFSAATLFLPKNMPGFELIYEGIIMIGFVIALFKTQITISIIISRSEKTLIYHTVNCFGKKRETKIDLLNALLTYEYIQIKKYSKGMCLKLYSRTGGNKIVLREDMDGYHQEQLEQIIALIKAIK